MSQGVFRLLRREAICGFSVLAVALAALAEALNYSLGTVARIGPGFLPVLYAVILACLGVGILVAGRHDATPIAAPALRPVLAIAAALLAWGWLAPRAGFVLATALLVILAALGHGRPRPAETLALAVCTAAVTTLIFIGGFALPLPIWP